MVFALDPRLRNDTLPLGHLPLSQLLLMNDQQYPWLILVPERAAVSELFELAEADRQQLMHEISAVAALLARLTRPTKINVATLGNIVRQLHVHIVARREGDAAWPGPVWGKLPPRPYPEAEALRWCTELTAALMTADIPFAPAR